MNQKCTLSSKKKYLFLRLVFVSVIVYSAILIDHELRIFSFGTGTIHSLRSNIYASYESSLNFLRSQLFYSSQQQNRKRNFTATEQAENHDASKSRNKIESANELESTICVSPSSISEIRLRDELRRIGLEPAESHSFKSRFIITPRVCLPSGSVAPSAVASKSNRAPKIISCFNCPAWFSSSSLNNRNRDFRSCEYTQCQFDLTGRLKDRADVVIFFVGYLGKNTPQPHRPPGQIWVKAFWEAPVFYGYPEPYDQWKSAFNWTFNYRTDSDIFAPVNLLAWRHRSLLLSDEEYLEIARKKTKSAAWFVSHCNSPSKRDKYVHEMQKYIDVDIYGKCGSLKCEKSNDKECNSLLNTTYKFYLSFENSHCRDYVTEKLFQRLADRAHVIPVVRGGFNYSHHLPPGWYVNTADFPTVKALADYLKNLAADDRRYAEMLKIKDMLVALGYKNDYCDFCQKLHTNEGTKTIPDVKQWSHKNTCYKINDII